MRFLVNGKTDDITDIYAFIKLVVPGEGWNLIWLDADPDEPPIGKRLRDFSCSRWAGGPGIPAVRGAGGGARNASLTFRTSQKANIMEQSDRGPYANFP